MEPDLLLAELQGTFRLVHGELEQTTMGGNPCDRDVVLILLDPYWTLRSRARSA